MFLLALNVKNRGIKTPTFLNTEKSKVAEHEYKLVHTSPGLKKKKKSFLGPTHHSNHTLKKKKIYNENVSADVLFQIQYTGNLYTDNFYKDQDKIFKREQHLPYVLSDQLDRWSRISLVKKAFIHFRKPLGQPGVGCKNVPECDIRRMCSWLR